MTEALYLDESDRRRFEATVERAVDDRVVLDRTCFYPTGGGQPNDTGLLRVAEGTTDTGEERGVGDAGDVDRAGDASGGSDGRWRVVDVTKKDTVYHVLAEDPPAPGTAVVGELDWDRRDAHMRYHTAQHLLSAVLLDDFDAETVGNQLYADHAHIDAAHDRFTATDLADIEARLNALVDADLPVRWYELDRETAEARLDTDRTRIHLLPDSITEVRIVEIGDGDDPLDRTACAGTHVASTGAVGEATVTGRETKGSEKERVEFVLE